MRKQMKVKSVGTLFWDDTWWKLFKNRIGNAAKRKPLESLRCGVEPAPVESINDFGRQIWRLYQDFLQMITKRKLLPLLPSWCRTWKSLERSKDQRDIAAQRWLLFSPCCATFCSFSFISFLFQRTNSSLSVWPETSFPCFTPLFSALSRFQLSQKQPLLPNLFFPQLSVSSLNLSLFSLSTATKLRSFPSKDLVASFSQPAVKFALRFFLLRPQETLSPSIDASFFFALSSVSLWLSFPFRRCCLLDASQNSLSRQPLRHSPCSTFSLDFLAVNSLLGPLPQDSSVFCFPSLSSAITSPLSF